MDDPEVQKLLLMATHNETDPTVQDDSLNLLAAQCQAGHFCDGEPVRTALMVALRYDRDASVRAKALDGLEPYVAEDTHVRDAILESLLHDPSMKVRSAAIHMLQPVQADSSVRVVLQTLAHQDQNAFHPVGVGAGVAGHAGHAIAVRLQIVTNLRSAKGVARFPRNKQNEWLSNMLAEST